VIARAGGGASRAARSAAFVLHPGICPEYRNAHGCFWALVNRDLARVGVTLLRADRGVSVRADVDVGTTTAGVPQS